MTDSDRAEVRLMIAQREAEIVAWTAKMIILLILTTILLIVALR